jgi:hypothetical protein
MTEFATALDDLVSKYLDEGSVDSYSDIIDCLEMKVQELADQKEMLEEDNDDE